MPTVQDIFREYGPAYLEKYGERIPTSHKKVIDAILSCRTSACGMIVYECTGCGKNHHIFRSCGNRHCPTCQNQKGLDWLEHQLTIQVPGPYLSGRNTARKALGGEFPTCILSVYAAGS